VVHLDVVDEASAIVVKHGVLLGLDPCHFLRHLADELLEHGGHENDLDAFGRAVFRHKIARVARAQFVLGFEERFRALGMELFGPCNEQIKFRLSGLQMYKIAISLMTLWRNLKEMGCDKKENTKTIIMADPFSLEHLV